MEKLRNTLNKVLNLLAGLSMTVMVVLTTYQVIVRYTFNSPSTGRKSWWVICSAGAPCWGPPSSLASAAT